MSTSHFCFLGLITLVLTATALGAEESLKSPDEWKQAKIVRSDKAKENLVGLSWKSEKVEVASEVSGSTFQPKVRIDGQFQREDWILVRGEQPLAVEKGTGLFSVEFPLQGEVTPVHIYGIGPLGEVEDEKLLVLFPGWEEFGRKLKELKTLKPAVYTGLGVSTISYNQTGMADFSEKAITLKAAYQGIWKAPWDYGFTTYITLLPFSPSQSGVSARFFGLNARVGYALASLREPWRLSLMGGVYYTTMLVSGTSFGYKHIGGPMVYPVLRRIVSARDAVSTYFKYSPVSDGPLGFLSLTSRELAVGVAWSRQEPGERPFSVSADFADLKIALAGSSSNSRSLSLGFAYGW